jgi:thiol-disulfide isomerase/thioredoxin
VRLVAIALASNLAAAACMPAPAPAYAPPPGPRDVLADLLAAPALDGFAGETDGPPGAAPRATVVVLFASWCTHCHDVIAALDTLRGAHPAMRVIGVNYRGHEEYDGRGNSEAVRNYVRNFAPWMRVVPIDEALFDELGRPPKVPTLFVYDARGALVETFDRRYRDQPGPGELDAVLARLGA